MSPKYPTAAHAELSCIALSKRGLKVNKAILKVISK